MISAHLTPKTGKDEHDLLTLKFASHDMSITGFKLDEVLAAIQTTTCHQLQGTNSAQAPFGKADKNAPPAIIEITLKPDKN